MEWPLGAKKKSACACVACDVEMEIRALAEPAALFPTGRVDYDHWDLQRWRRRVTDWDSDETDEWKPGQIALSAVDGPRWRDKAPSGNELGLWAPANLRTSGRSTPKRLAVLDTG